VVLGLYARIKRDPRHEILMLLTGRTVAQRAFADWSMACERGQEGAEGGM
jgi:hypothetical protein